MKAAYDWYEPDADRPIPQPRLVEGEDAEEIILEILRGSYPKLDDDQITVRKFGPQKYEIVLQGEEGTEVEKYKLLSDGRDSKVVHLHCWEDDGDGGVSGLLAVVICFEKFSDVKELLAE